MSSSDETTRPAPQLIFDDGSRVMMEEAASNETPVQTASPRGSVSIKEYYEVDRLVQEIQSLDITRSSSSSSSSSVAYDGWSVRVALQLPDNLLVDAADVSWEFETALSNQTTNSQALVFVLGDTTFAPCCIDAVAAQHLQADFVVHYGHACLSPCRDIPVFYSFGRQELSPAACVEAVVQEIKVNQQTEREVAGDSDSVPVQRVLVLYQVCYHHRMQELEALLREQGSFEQVLMGKIPSPEKRAAAVLGTTPGCGRSDCCSNDEKGVPAETVTSDVSATTTPVAAVQDSESELPMINMTAESFVVGGLEIPKDSDWSSFTLLYVGDETCRQYLNIVLRMLSGSGPARYWTWRPKTSTLSTDLSPAFQRRFSRRYYLVQKARQANVFGILVASLSDTYMRTVVASLRRVIQKHDRTAYTMVVGKINPSKLANFGEIDCFCMVACPEHSLLDDDREYHVPVLTPLELAMALGDAEWGVTQYSLDIQDYLQAAAAAPTVTVTAGDNDNQEDKEEDTDAPYFSLVTGRYESKAPAQTQDTDLTALPGKGQVAQYHSAAAAHLKQREYQGLQVLEGKTEVHAAAQGDKGIASNYGDR